MNRGSPKGASHPIAISCLTFFVFGFFRIMIVRVTNNQLLIHKIIVLNWVVLRYIRAKFSTWLYLFTSFSIGSKYFFKNWRKYRIFFAFNPHFHGDYDPSFSLRWQRRVVTCREITCHGSAMTYLLTIQDSSCTFFHACQLGALPT